MKKRVLTSKTVSCEEPSVLDVRLQILAQDEGGIVHSMI